MEKKFSIRNVKKKKKKEKKEKRENSNFQRQTFLHVALPKKLQHWRFDQNTYKPSLSNSKVSLRNPLTPVQQRFAACFRKYAACVLQLSTFSLTFAMFC